MFRKFASIAFPNKYGYAYDTNAHDSRGGLTSNFRMFETYGDGLVQHSGDWAITQEFLADYLLSLAEFAQNDEELTQELYFTMHRGAPERDIEFAASVIYKAPPEGKEYTHCRYFSLEERKISASPAKEHDKRYFKITDNFDGSAKSIVSVLCWNKRDWIGGWEAFQIVCAAYEWIQKQDGLWMEMPGKYMKWFEHDKANENEKARELRDAYDAMRNLTEAYRLRENAKSAIEQGKNRAERAAKKAAETEAK